MAEYSIYNSQWTAQQIEASIGKNPRIGESGNWEVWNMSSMQFVDTGVLAEGKRISHVDRTSGTGLPGTTDTYTIYDNDETVIGTFNVHNGSDGQGSPGSQTPKMDGTAAAGTANAYSREDHVHPHDDSKADLVNGKVPSTQLPEISATKTYNATIGTTWVEDENTGVKSQQVAISGVLATQTAKVDHAYTGNGSSASYETFVEAENQYLNYITNGYAETYNGGVKFYIFGDPNTVTIPIIVEVS